MVRESNLRQPGRRRYSMKDHGSSFNDEGRIGSHILKKGSGCSYWKPSWNKTKTVIRIFPGLNPDNPEEFDPYRISTEPLDFGDWVRTYPAVRNFGDPGLTMLLNDPSSEEPYDANTNPCWILYRAIEQKCKNGDGKPEWYPLREGGAGRGKKLSKPSSLGLVQCSLFCHKNNEFFDPDNGTPPKGGAPEDPTVVFEIPVSAIKTLFDLLEKRDEDWKGDPDDWDQYTYGDIVSLDKGAFVWLYEKGTSVGAAPTRAAPRTAFGGSRKTEGGSGGGMDFTGFECQITKEYNGAPAVIPSELESLIHDKVKPWDDIVQFYSNDEQAFLLNGVFPASAVLFAFRDHPEWIDSTTKRMAVGTKQVDMRGAKPGPEDDEPAPARSGGAWGPKRPAPKPQAVDDELDPVDEDEPEPEPAPVRRKPKQDDVVPVDELEDEVGDIDDDVPAAPVKRASKDLEDDDLSEFDEEPTKKVKPEEALESVKNARTRSQARSRRNK